MRTLWSRHLARGLGLGLVIAGSAAAFHAQASEDGASFYLLGSGGPGAAILPPLPGVFFANTAFYYHGSAGAGHEFVDGGHVVVGLRGTVAADFLTGLWVPTTHFLGGTLAIAGTLPVGESKADVSAVLTGPNGNPLTINRGDSAFVVADPAVTAELGWQHGDFHYAVTSLVNVPIGEYRNGQLANIAFHRWADDLSAAVTWHDDKSGWDVSAKTGFTFNGENPDTDYVTGTEWHFEYAVEKSLTKAWALGLQGYYFHQVTGDSGSGAKLGPFEGRVVGIGGEAAYNFVLGKTPVTLRLHGTTEFAAQNRAQGHSVWLDLTFPIWLKLPAGPPR
jgi:hypothetical protein